MAVAKKVAVLLPEAYGGGTQRAALNFAIQIHDGAKSANDAVVVEFGYVEGEASRDQQIFDGLRERNIGFRPFKVKRFPREKFVQIRKWREPAQRVSDPNILVFDDGISNFDDADYRIIISDRLMDGLVAPTSPYSIVIFDFIQRYVPQIFDRASPADSAALWRTITGIMKNYVAADAIFVTSDQAASDAVGFGGARKAQVCKLPLSFDPILQDDPPPSNTKYNKDPRGYIIWTTNVTPHKNHKILLQGLETFYRANPKAPMTLVTGVQTENFNIEKIPTPVADVPYVHQIRAMIESSDELTKNVKFMGDLSNRQYVQFLRGAKALLHGAIFDNGTFSVAEAAWHGVPSLSSKYAAMVELGRAFQIPLTFYETTDSEDMAAALTRTLSNNAQLRYELPTRDDLRRCSRDAQSAEVWSLISRVMARSQDLDEVIPA